MSIDLCTRNCQSFSEAQFSAAQQKGSGNVQNRDVARLLVGGKHGCHQLKVQSKLTENKMTLSFPEVGRAEIHSTTPVLVFSHIVTHCLCRAWPNCSKFSLLLEFLAKLPLQQSSSRCISLSLSPDKTALTRQLLIRSAHKGFCGFLEAERAVG